MKIFFSVGEPSGDLHGSNLIRELRRQDPHVKCVGFGGPRMGAAGCDLLVDLTQYAVMWIAKVLINLHRFIGFLLIANRYFQEERPDAVVLIDYPGFNWWIARRAKAHGIPVYYYGTPQMWAWASWRIGKMRRLVDHALCKLPFEESWYRERGCNATYVGHPFFDQLAVQTYDEPFLARHGADLRPLVTILPGSRTQEVHANLEGLLSAAEQVTQHVEGIRFAIASFNAKQGNLAKEKVDRLNSNRLKRGLATIPIEVHVGKTQELMKLAACCMACSGSVSLELLYHVRPTVILYRMKRAFHWLAHRVIHVRFITLVNILGSPQPLVAADRPRKHQVPTVDEMIMPEYPTSTDRSRELASHVIQWLTDETARRHTEQRLLELKRDFAHPGASRTAAEYILRTLAVTEGVRRAA